MSDRCASNQRKFILGLALAIGALTGTVCEASPYGPYVSLGGEIADVEFKEWDAGSLVNAEEGSLLYGALTFGYRRADDVYFAASYTFSDSSVDYEGLSQLGQPFSTTTDYDISGFQMLSGVAWSRGAFYLGVGRNSAERDIQPTSLIQGLNETHEIVYGVIGADLILFEDSTMRVKWDTHLISSFDSTLDIRFPNELDDARIPTGKFRSTVTELEFLKYFPNHWSIAVAPRYTSGSTRRSHLANLTEDGEDTGLTYFHPESRHKRFGLGITVSRYF